MGREGGRVGEGGMGESEGCMKLLCLSANYIKFEIW